MRFICRTLVWCFAIYYLGALVVFLIGTYGLFGQERDPLSAVYLVPAGLPWNLIPVGPDEARGWIAAAVPLVNLAILMLLCRGAGRR